LKSLGRPRKGDDERPCSPKRSGDWEPAWHFSGEKTAPVFLYPELMKQTIVEQVEEWYLKNHHKLASSFAEVNFRLMESRDPLLGKTVIELGASSSMAAFTFWNKGDVEALALDSAKQEHILDDRRLTPDDDIHELLDRYLNEFSSLLTD
jgi:hypothetical protein